MVSHPSATFGEAVLVTGVAGPLGCAVAYRLAACCPALALAAPDVRAARAMQDEVDRLRTLHAMDGATYTLTADLARPKGAAAVLAAARAALGPPTAVVACASVEMGGVGDGAPAPRLAPFKRLLDAVCALPAAAHPRELVLAGCALPPLDERAAREALEALAGRAASRLRGRVHVVTVTDPHASAAVRAFGLMDRPFGADVEHAVSRVRRAAEAVCAAVVGSSVPV